MRGQVRKAVGGGGIGFFIDNSLSHHLANGMRAFGEDVFHLTDCFPADVPDTTWLEYAGKKGLVVITKDERLRYNPAERAALLEHKVGAFFMGGKNLNRCGQIQQAVRNWPKMKEFAKKTQPPYAFRVPPRGTKFSRIPLP